MAAFDLSSVVGIFQTFLLVYLAILAFKFIFSASWSEKEEKELKPMMQQNGWSRWWRKRVGEVVGVAGPGAQKTFHDWAGGFDWQSTRQVINEQRGALLDYVTKCKALCGQYTGSAITIQYRKKIEPDPAAPVFFAEFNKLCDEIAEDAQKAVRFNATDMINQGPLIELEKHLVQLDSAKNLSDADLRKATNDPAVHQSDIAGAYEALRKVLGKKEEFGALMQELNSYCVLFEGVKKKRIEVYTATPTGADCVAPFVKTCQPAIANLIADLTKFENVVKTLPFY